MTAAQSTIRPPQAVTGVELARGIGVQPAKGFWEDAWSQVIRRPSAIAGLIWIGIVGFFAVFSPFIANGLPLIERVLAPDGTIESVSWPLFERLTATDILLVIGAIGGAIWLALPLRLPRQTRLGALFVASVQAGITVLIIRLIAGAAADRDAADWLRALERGRWFDEIVCAVVALVVAAPFVALPVVPHRVVRMSTAVLVLVVAGSAAWITWAAYPASFEYRAREAAGQTISTYTLIPWSPNQRRTDLDLLHPGASYHSPQIKSMVPGRSGDVFDAAARDAAVARFDELRLPPADHAELERSIAVALEARGTVTVAEARRVIGDRVGPWFLLGTDSLGQDVLSQMLHACRLSISIGLVSTTIAVLIGVTIGALMGYFGGWTDMLLFRIVEIFMAVPVLFLLIVAAGLLPPQFRSTYVIMVIIGCFTWTGAARFIRAEFMRLRTQDFVQSARAVGLPLRSVLFRHMLPNGVTPVLVDASFAIAVAILFESILSFLGLGPPDQASWGRLLSDATNQVGNFVPHLALYPGAAIFLTVLSFTLIGEALRDAIDPKLKKARV